MSEVSAEMEKTAHANKADTIISGGRGKESINPAVILSDIPRPSFLQPSGRALMSLSHSEPRIRESVRVIACARTCVFVRGPTAGA